MLVPRGRVSGIGITLLQSVPEVYLISTAFQSCKLVVVSFPDPLGGLKGGLGTRLMDWWSLRVTMLNVQVVPMYPLEDGIACNNQS